MLTSLIYPLPMLFSYFAQWDNLVLWSMLIISAGLNTYLFRQNKMLKIQLNRRRILERKQTSANSGLIRESQQGERSRIDRHSKQGLNNSSEKNRHIPVNTVKTASLSTLEYELNEIIRLDDDNDNCKNQPALESIERESNHSQHPIHNVLQSMTGWHKSLVPFLLQNIGWFIGILCFISGSVFFISYTEGFSKSITIFFTILSYTLLLAWGGYRLRDKVAHAATSGNILMATSFLLIPLNFSAAAQLIGNSIGSSQYTIAIIATIIALGTLFYITRLISGIFNRQLLHYFPGIYFSLSTIQLVVPMLHNSQGMALMLVLQSAIMSLLFMALIGYLPTMLKQTFVDKKYLLLFSIGSLIFAALVSAIHITIAYPITIIISYYAPVVLLISAALFYMDGQLSAYKNHIPLLSWFSLLAYALSFVAIVMSLDADLSRMFTLLLAGILYTRLMWLYRSLVPLYLVIIVLGFLHYDVILSELLTSEAAYQWSYLLTLPLLGLFSLALLLLRKSEIQRNKQFQLTRHLFHMVIVASIGLGVFSQWYTSSVFIALSNSILVILIAVYLFKSEQYKMIECLGREMTGAYSYLILFLPVMLVLISSPVLFDTDMKIALMTVLALGYSLNSHLLWLRFASSNSYKREMEKEVLINTSLMISLLLLVLVVIGFTLSLKTAVLIFFLALNSLFLSLSLYNRGLFYVFMVIASVSVVVFKLTLSSSTSTGLLTMSGVLILFYIVHWLDRKRMDEVEAFAAATKQRHNPEKLLWCYPVNDFAVTPTPAATEENNNV